jgi:hypothetical protein
MLRGDANATTSDDERLAADVVVVKGRAHCSSADITRVVHIMNQ